MFELLLPIGLLILGMIILIISSNKTVDHSVILACNWSVPPIVIGLVLVSIGTDFPEIINSVIASSLDLGNINIGTSIGSAFSQLTLILGIIAISLKSFEIIKKEVLIIGSSIFLTSILSFLLVLDSYISREDGFLLVISWVLFVLIIRNIAKKEFTCPLLPEQKRTGYNIIMLILGFIGVAFGTFLVIESILEIAQILSISEFIVSFFIASIGTSLPELTVTLAALRKGQQELAIGDIMGSSLLDASISIGIGPLLFPTPIYGGPFIGTWVYTIVTFLVLTLLLFIKGRVDRKLGIICLSLYFFSYSLLFLS